MSETFSDKLTKKVAQAVDADESEQTGAAIKLYEEAIKEPIPSIEDDLTEATIKAKETATYNLAAIYKSKGLVDELISLQRTILPLFLSFPKSKTAKIMRTLFDMTI